MSKPYNMTELMACVAARFLEDRKIVFVGTGLPILAAMLAQRLHAPNMVIFFEAGGLGPEVPALPISVGDSRTFYKALMATSMDYVMSCAQLGYFDYAFLGGAQIDMYGNLNTTVIGEHDNPKVRLPGSGGANDGGSLAWRTIIIMRQDPQKFVEKVDFITTPGYLSGPGAREKAGLPEGSGPYRVITQLGVYDFDEETKRMRLISVHPGVTVEDVMKNTSFELLVADKVETTEEPSPRELEILRGIREAWIVIGKQK
ncbi:MAG: CoA-transferase subunit beta [Candidatus Freyarchaeota archaeon]|nr:CoA-transferase [Candidatus Freyrarchaeum guaymaensis]